MNQEKKEIIIKTQNKQEKIIEKYLEIFNFGWGSGTPAKCKKTLEEFAEELRTQTLNEVIEKIELYFKGLIAIPDPQATKENLILSLKQKSEEEKQ